MRLDLLFAVRACVYALPLAPPTLALRRRRRRISSDWAPIAAAPLPTSPPTFWPKSDSAQRSANVSHVFRSLIQLRDAWQNPETDESENDADDTGDWREASAEDLNHVA